MNKEDLLAKIRANIYTTYDMPSFDDMKGVQYADPLKQFVEMSKTVGGKVVELENGQDINEVIKTCYPDAKVIASNLPEVTIANRNPDTVAEANDLNGTDVGVVRGVFGVAENGCIWIPQTMKEKAMCFISEYLVIMLDRKQIVNNMHEAYQRVEFNSYGYGCFISGPSKTADIAQALVMGAQAARGVTVVLE
ncbi:MAG: LUD domain-containing protein [Prevotellaceae bacterium]|nr:LUD domain-containing protein [Prevotellaceae bacterium]